MGVSSELVQWSQILTCHSRPVCPEGVLLDGLPVHFGAHDHGDVGRFSHC